MAESWVWAHFRKPAKKGDKALCQVPTSTGQPCGAHIAVGNGTSSLAYHLTSLHGIERNVLPKKQKVLQWGKAIGTAPEFPLKERELLCVAWAANGLSYDLVEDPLFRRCFSASLPIGMNRHKLSEEMVALSERSRFHLPKTLFLPASLCSQDEGSCVHESQGTVCNAGHRWWEGAPQIAKPVNYLRQEGLLPYQCGRSA